MLVQECLHDGYAPAQKGHEGAVSKAMEDISPCARAGRQPQEACIGSVAKSAVHRVEGLHSEDPFVPPERRVGAREQHEVSLRQRSKGLSRAIPEQFANARCFDRACTTSGESRVPLRHCRV